MVISLKPTHTSGVKLAIYSGQPADVAELQA